MRGKCDAPRCGFPAEVGSRLGGRYCSGHYYLADRDDDPERDRDPEVERRWYGVGEWGGDENG